jgi:hypothetical protein
MLAIWRLAVHVSVALPALFQFLFVYVRMITCLHCHCSTGNHEKPASGSADVHGNSDASGGECGVPYTYRCDF